jgi:hypothetical protein
LNRSMIQTDLGRTYELLPGSEMKMSNALNREKVLREWCEDNGLTLSVKNNHEHWIFKREDFLAEWWPSTSRLVFNKSWKRYSTVFDSRGVRNFILKRMSKETVTRPAYLDYLVYLGCLSPTEGLDTL